MICRNCNAEIDDNSVQCPFCQTPTTVDVDPNAAPADPFAAPENPIPDPAQPPQDYSQPAQDFNQPAQDYSQPAPNYGQPTPPPVQPTVDPAAYDPNLTDGKDIEKEAKTVWTLGLVGLIVTIVIGFCCCALPGPICAIIGLVKAKGLDGSIGLLSADGQNKLKTGKILCWVAIGLGAAGIIVNIVLSATGTISNIIQSNS